MILHNQPIPANQQTGHGFSNGRGKDPNTSYVEVLYNLEYWRINNTKDKITKYGSDWWWCPKHKMDEKFGGMYMNHSLVKHD